MKNITLLSRHRQNGAVLIVGLIMLVVITLLVMSAFNLSMGNLKAVGNMQFRNEVIAASNAAIEDVVNSLLIGGSTIAPPAQTISIDINNDGTADYTVTTTAPVCIRATTIASASTPGAGSSLSLGVPTTANSYYTVWDIDATVTDNVTGAATEAHQGVRVLLSQAQKNAVCPLMGS